VVTLGFLFLRKGDFIAQGWLPWAFYFVWQVQRTFSIVVSVGLLNGSDV
jgi:hypothetical protein